MRYPFGFIGMLALSLSALWVAGLSIQGCGDDADDFGNCSSYDEGDLRCEGTEEGIVRCSGQRWMLIEDCEEPIEMCVDPEDGDPYCQCQGSASRCANDDTAIEHCEKGYWSAIEPCGQGRVCEEEFQGHADCVIPGGAPLITEVKWVWDEQSCGYMTPSDVTITTTATPADLRYEGSVSDCDGDINGLKVVLTCENLTLMTGSVTVTDLDNRQASVSFEFDGCVDGRVCADGEPCCNESKLRCSESDPSVIEQCAADGNWVLSETCAEGYLCDVHASSAVCHAAECVDLDRRCFESDDLPGTDVEYCQNGTWLLADSCQRLKPDGWVCREDNSTNPPAYYCAAGP